MNNEPDSLFAILLLTLLKILDGTTLIFNIKFLYILKSGLFLWTHGIHLFDSGKIKNCE